ncbi:MAG: hypothetical protein QOF83_2352, partial [Solirubrobacteraceae bacterium]|nr:hypothetical protein [Solirubrobacteraceae bacterium]
TEPTQRAAIRAGSPAIPVLRLKLFAPMTRSRCQTLRPCRVHYADRPRRSSPKGSPSVADSGDCDRPFRPKVITDSGDRDHAPDAADWIGVRVAAICAVDTNTGCIRRVVPVKAAEDRPWSPRRGPARDAQCPHERRSGARGEGLWAPVGDQFTDSHAAELSLATRRRRSDGPLRSMRWARWMMRSRMASARVGSPMTSCQRLAGS